MDHHQNHTKTFVKLAKTLIPLDEVTVLLKRICSIRQREKILNILPKYTATFDHGIAHDVVIQYKGLTRQRFHVKNARPSP